MTLQDLGLAFTHNDGCQTCHDGECHSQQECKYDGKTYFIHVMANVACGTYTATITSQAEGDEEKGSEILADKSNTEVATYLHERFGFRCA